MERRLKLHQILLSILGTNYIYFQPPTNVSIKHPCVLYTWKAMDQKYADDTKYLHKKCYSVTIVDRNPDSDLPMKVGELPLSSFDRQYVADNLYHWVYTLYF